MKTFKEVAKYALENKANKKNYRNKRSFQRWHTIVNKYLNPKLGDLDINDITTDIVVDTISDLWMNQTPTAKLARSILYHIIGYSIHRHWRNTDFNPARWKDCLSFDLPSASDIHTAKHREAISIGEAQRIMPLLASSNTIGDLATAFGLLTACRSSEYTQAKWSEIDFEKRTLSIPPERCKVKRTEPFVVPLSNQAIDILKKIERKGEYVFTSKLTGLAITSFVPRQCMKRILPNHKGITAHGNRATFSTWCAETGKDPVTREICLMHIVGNAVSNAYNHSNALDNRRLLMQQWADAIYHD